MQLTPSTGSSCPLLPEGRAPRKVVEGCEEGGGGGEERVDDFG